MKLRDKINTQSIGGAILPKLHGHTKIILTDVKTGEQEIHEKDNLVTDAVATIFAKNLWGTKNYEELLPLTDMFGGVLCFEDELTESATNIWLPSESENKVIAHCGQTAHSSASTTRGNYNGTLSKPIPEADDIKTGFRFVYDFPTNVGNGQISSLALTHKWLGDIGTRPVEAVDGETLLIDNTNKTKVYEEDGEYPSFDDALFCALDIDDTNGTGTHVYLSDTNGNTSLIVKELVNGGIIKRGINQKLGYFDVESTHTITLTRAFRARNSAVCIDVSGNIYVVTAGNSSGHTLYINKIDPADNYAVTAMTITEQSMDLGYIQSGDTGSMASANAVNLLSIQGGYIYFPNSTNRSFYKIKLEDSTSDITLLDSNLTENLNINLCGMVNAASNLIYGANFIVNGNTVYPSQFSLSTNLKSCTSTRTLSYRSPVLRFLPTEDLCYEWAYEYDEDYNARFYLCSGFPLDYIATIQNLSQPVVKDNSKTMQIQYTITIVDEE